MTAFSRGRRVGVDVGSVRVGVAISDPDGILATPVETVARGRGDVERIAGIVDEYEAVGVVVGLPRTLRGERGRAADEADRFAQVIAARVAPVPVEFADERFSTVTASQAMRASGRSAKTQRAEIDQAAAVTILQGWLDLRRSQAAAASGAGETNEGDPA
ncbi:Holliday junction resolvase RuvX [Williamsia sterculiae]|uniref:Putative pre-16S rRNA nuclease n=1 Tax=Williamsia sterculiae TaxID=1344003 RepID=A0A1N7EHV0_9NOCA|nr:Holliday junction resolvase RuvX [Williamsia sterculiae]SIR87505.1 putative holliday junction resolvase [Williamsia sterculiae]